MELQENALITEEFAKSIIGQREFDEPEGEESKLAYLINTISSKIELYIGRELIEKEREILVKGNNSIDLFVPIYPVRELTVDGVPQSVYSYSKSGIVTKKLGNWGESEYKITYTAGWPINEVPYSIRKICIAFLISEKGKLNNNAFGISSMNMSEGTNISYTWDLSLEDKKVLDTFKESFV